MPDKIFIVEEYRFWVEDYSDCTDTLHAFLRKEDAIEFIREYISHKESGEFGGEYSTYTEIKEGNTFVCTVRIMEIPFKA